MSTHSKFIEGLQKASQICEAQTQLWGKVTEGPMASDPERLKRQSMSAGAMNARALILTHIDDDTERGAFAEHDDETTVRLGLVQGAAYCDDTESEHTAVSNGPFVTEVGKQVHKAMAAGAQAAGVAIRLEIEKTENDDGNA